MFKTRKVMERYYRGCFGLMKAWAFFVGVEPKLNYRPILAREVFTN